ncbi:MAG: response regulator, partial [Sphingobacteriaceae bacterium]
MIEEALNDEGYQVKTFTGTENIFLLIKEFDPNLIIMDYILNGINGGEFCRQVKNNPATAALPVMICSAFSRVIESLGDYGCDAFLAKPFDFEKEVDFILPLVKSGDEVVRHEGYTLRYRDQYKDADWVAYPLLNYETTGDADRKYEQFRPDPSVDNGTALPSDYTRSGYDRGHLAPAGDFKFSQRIMRETFFMSNITPQAPDFNRGIWKELEEKVRSWAIRDKGIYVVTGAVLKPGLPTIGKAVEVSVPEKFYKVILYCDKPNIRMVGFLLNNEASNSPLSQFV